MGALVDRMGDRYGRLVVVGRAENSKQKKAMWVCLCDCGNKSVVSGTHLRNNHSTSCGCRKGLRTHGMSDTRSHIAWLNMKQRCLNVTGRDYKDYGGRGITICPEWVSSFEAFYRDMGDSPEGLSLDRINNDGGYSLANCRWATAIEQANNKRPRRDRVQ